MQVIGNWLDYQGQNKLLKEVRVSNDFQILIKEMKKEFLFNNNSYEISMPLQMDVQQGDIVAVSESFTIEYTDSVKVDIHSADIEGENSIFVSGHLVNDTSHVVFKVIDGEINRTEHDLSELKLNSTDTVKKELEEFPFSDEYYPGILIENPNRVRSLIPDSFKGCLYGGYIWCGMDCGGPRACESGSAVGINYLDSSCKVHDCCYHRRDVTFADCVCDEELCRLSDLAKDGPAKRIVQLVMCTISPSNCT